MKFYYFEKKNIKMEKKIQNYIKNLMRKWDQKAKRKKEKQNNFLIGHLHPSTSLITNELSYQARWKGRKKN